MFNSIRFLILLVAFILSYQLFSQEAVIDTSKNILLLRERSYGALLHTQGWGIKYSRGYNKTAFKKRMLVFEFVEMKSQKQIKSINPYFTNSKSFVYGKLNSLFVLRGTYGMHKQLNRKPYWGGVELRFVYMGGISVGLAKPVYLYILNLTSSSFDYTITEEKFDPDKHAADEIFGRAPFFKGINEISIYPGFHAKIGLDFDYGSYSTKVKSLEIGAIVDIFPRPVPIMAFVEPNYFFLTLYLNINFGKRFNK